MAKGIHDIGNGFGYVYQTDVDGITISTVVANNPLSIRQLRKNGNAVSPFASKRSAYGSTTFTMGVAGAGSITGVAINGVDQLPGPILVTGLTDAECAELVADAVNSFTPGSGFDFTAVAVGGIVYYFAPPSAGATPNGYAIVISDTGAVVTYTTVAFANGSNESGVYDTVMGSRYFLNADYNAAGISGGTPADPNSLTDSVEITKYFVNRGQQLGIFSKNIQANNYTVSGIDRSGFMTKIFVQPQAGNTQTVVKLAAEDFVDGDLVFLQSLVDTDAITVESAPAVSVAVIGNIYLTNNVPWTNLGTSSLMLQFKYDTTLGPIFVEVSRSISDSKVDKSVFVMPNGDDTTGKPYYFNRPYATLTAAKDAASSGDTIIVYPGNYSDNDLAKDGVNYYFMPGAVVANNGLHLFEVNTFDVNIYGSGVFTGGAYCIYRAAGGPGSLFMRGKSISNGGVALYIGDGTGNVDVHIEDHITSGTCVFFTGAGMSGKYIIKTKLIESTDGTTGVYAGAAAISLNVLTFTADCKIYADRIITDNTSSVANINLSFGPSSPGSVEVYCPSIVNRNVTVNVPAVYISAPCNFLKIVGNIYCDGTGSLTDAIWLRVGSPGSPNFMEMIGDIYTEAGMAVNVITPSGVKFSHQGDIFCKTTNIPSGAVGIIPCAVYITEGPAGAGVFATLRFKAGSINQFQAGSGCIFKGMYTNGGNDIDNRVELIGMKLYVDDVTTNSIIGEAPVGPATNQVITVGSITNVAPDANITETGTAMAVTTQLYANYPPSFNV